jgi:hypothetical protein
MRDGMSRPRTVMHGETPDGVVAKIDDECLELDAATPAQAEVMRRWVGRVNGSTYPQPYLVEGPPGRFRLYVGEAAERVRTARGIQ